MPTFIRAVAERPPRFLCTLVTEASTTLSPELRADFYLRSLEK